MRILVKENESVIADLSFEDEDVYVGSQTDCGLHLADLRVAARQALISQATDGTWYLENLDLGNQVLLNNHAAIQRTRLQNDDEICLFDYTLKVYLDAGLEQHVVEDSRLNTEELVKIREYPLPAGSVVKRSFDQITLPQSQMQHLARRFGEIYQVRDIHELLDASLSLLLEEFHARSAWVGIRLKTQGELEVQAGRLASGQSAGLNPIIDLLRYRCVERGQHVCIRKVRDTAEINSAMAVPLHTADGVLGMLYVDRRPGTRRFQIPDLDVLTILGSYVSTRLDAIVCQRHQRSSEILSTEISVIHAIQAQLDPKNAPSGSALRLAAYTRSGQENPGDVYDIMKHPDTEITSFLLGHVNGTGALLGLSMARLHATFRVAMLHSDPPHAFARQLNWLMYDEKDPTTVDAICLVAQPSTGKLRFCRSGKIGAFIVTPQGEPRAMTIPDAPTLGAVRNYEYVTSNDTLAPGETLVLYTRGVSTASNAEGERFREMRFIQLACDGFGQSPSTTLQDITDELSGFFAGGRHPDDITIILIARPG